MKLKRDDRLVGVDFCNDDNQNDNQNDDIKSKRIFYLDNRPTLAIVSPAPCNRHGRFVKRTSANSQVQIVQDLKFPK